MVACAAELSKALDSARRQIINFQRRGVLSFPIELPCGLTTLRVFEAWANKQPEAQQLEFEPMYGNDAGYLYPCLGTGYAQLVKLPCSARTAIAERVTNALRQGLAERGLGHLVKPAERTPRRYRLSTDIFSGEYKHLGWSRCPDASLLLRSATAPPLVVEVGMPGETHVDLHYRCQRWLADPKAYGCDEIHRAECVIAVKVDHLDGSNDLVIAVTLMAADGVKEMLFIPGRPAADLSGRNVWQVPVRALLGWEGVAGVEGAGEEVSEVKIALDVRAALAELPGILAQQP